MQSKAKRVILLIVAAAIGLMSTRLLFTVIPQKEAKIDTSAGVSYISEHEAIKVTQTTTKKEPETTGKKKKRLKIKNNNYKAAYKDILIVGDSLVEAITEYGILDDKQVIGMIGGTTIYLSEITDKIVKKKPKAIVLHFGENELGKKSYADIFIPRYAKSIKKLKKKLPNTEIYVDSIFPVKKKAYKKEPYTKNIPYYNKRLKAMAKELGVHYIDFTPEFKSYKKDYYDADGVHPIKSFYTQQYLPYVYTEVKSKN